MNLENKEKEKVLWEKKEKQIRRSLLFAIVGVLLLMAIILFFRQQIWAIITGSGIVVGLLVDFVFLWDNFYKG